MKKVKKVFIITISVLTALALLIFLLYQIYDTYFRKIGYPTYTIPEEFVTNLTEEEHKNNIKQRADEIANIIGYTGEIKYDLVYNKKNYPCYFIVEFDDVVEFKVLRSGDFEEGLKKYAGNDLIPNGIDGCMVQSRYIYGVIINDEYYLYAFGDKMYQGIYETADLCYDKDHTYPPSTYTMLDVWDCKKYITGAEFFQKGETIYRANGCSEILDEYYIDYGKEVYLTRRYWAEIEEICNVSDFIVDSNKKFDIHITSPSRPSSLDDVMLFKAVI